MRFAVGVLAACAAFAQTASTPQKPASISGTVVTVNGEPIRRADVHLRSMASRGPGGMQTATTDGAGNFTFLQLEPGQYWLSAEKPGFVRREFGASRGGRMGSPVRLAPGEARTGITLKLTPHAVIAGKIIDDEGEAMPGVQVQALQQRYFRGRKQWVPAGGTQANDLGEYRIAGLAPGWYVVSVSPSRRGGPMRGPAARPAPSSGLEESYVTTYYPGTADIAQSTPVGIAAGGELRGIDVRAVKTRTYRVSGRILEGGEPVQNAMVMLLPARDESVGMMGRPTSSARGKDGAFELTGVPPGQYMLQANRFDQRSRLSGSQEVSVGEQNVEGVVVNLGGGFEVPGRVVVAGRAKAAVDGVRVMLEPQTGFGFGNIADNTSDDGSFKLDQVTPGKYRVSTSIPDTYVRAVRAGGQETQGGMLDLSTGAPGPVEVIVSADGGAIDGTIHDSKKRPAEGVTVVLVPEPALRSQAHLYRNAASSSTGTFQFRGLPPGEYKVFAWEEIEDGSWMDPAVIARYESDGKAIAIKDGAQTSVTLAFIPPEGGSRIEKEADERDRNQAQ
jgi:hypothetical protein